MADRVGIRGRTIEVYVRFSDPSGEPVNADVLPSVEVIDSNGVVRRILNTAGVSQITDSPGLYKFTYGVPLSGPDGYWMDRWVALIGDETVESSFGFTVQEGGVVEQDIDAVFTPGAEYEFDFTKDEVDGINKILTILKKRLKSDGIRKVPDGAGGYIEERCDVFNDDELICFIVNSLSEFNQWPHFTSFTFADSQIQGIFLDIIVQGANLLALAAQTLIEKGREFTITDNGVTYQPPQISEILNSQYGTQLGYYKEKLKMIKTSLKPSPKGLGTFRVTAVSPNFLRLRHLRERQIL
jgi:hypothetical protein